MIKTVPGQIYDQIYEIVALRKFPAKLRNQNVLVSLGWSLNASLISYKTIGFSNCRESGTYFRDTARKF